MSKIPCDFQLWYFRLQGLLERGRLGEFRSLLIGQMLRVMTRESASRIETPSDPCVQPFAMLFRRIACCLASELGGRLPGAGAGD